MSKISSKKRANGFIFVIAMWLLSRIVIVVTMLIVTPLIPGSVTDSEFHFPGFTPAVGWERFSHWDGNWYWKIATLGYDYANDGQGHSIAFFPLFPLVVRGVMLLGFRFEVAGTLVNNLAFLGALLLLYRWAKERSDISSAMWATAVLAWCPYSLFGTVIYTEGLFLFLTTTALRAFENRQHAWAAFWAAMATATRLTGTALVPTFLIVAWREGRPTVAYVAGLGAGGGLLLFSVYCAIRFADPLAFVHVQRGWGQHGAFSWQGWLEIFYNLTLGNGLNQAVNSLTKVVMVFGGSYLLWRLRTKLSRVAVTYGFCSLALLLTSGAVNSANRYAYGIVSLSLALGVLLDHHRRLGYATMSLFAILLVCFALRFAQWRWVA